VIENHRFLIGKSFLKAILIVFFFSCLDKGAYAQVYSDGVRSFADSTMAKSNKLVVLDNVFVVGNRKTKENIITRELSVQKDGVYSLADLHYFMVLDQRKVFNTRLFLQVDFNLLQLSEERVLLVISVSERNYIFPIPFVNLADRNLNDWWVNQNRDISRISYGVRIDHNNLSGNNDRLKIIVQQGFTRRYEVQYVFPYLDSEMKHGFIASSSYRRNNIVATRTEDHVQRFTDFKETARDSYSAGLTYSYRPGFYSFHFLAFRYMNSNISDSLAQLSPNYFELNSTRQRAFYLSYQFRKDYRDVIGYPLNGHLFNFQIEKYGLGIFNDIDTWEVTANFSKYVDLKRGFYFSTLVGGKMQMPEEVPYFNFMAMGFRQFYVRGYELSLIEGQSYLLQKSTIKKRIFSHNFRNIGPLKNSATFGKVPLAVYIKGYFDSGVVENTRFYPESNRLNNRYLYGYGLGLDFVSFYDSVFRLEYSFNNSGQNGFFINYRADF
jgi:hypothetical protein